MSWGRGTATLLAIWMWVIAPAFSAVPAANSAGSYTNLIRLSPVQPMDGKDVGGLGGIHKLELLYPSFVYSNGLKPADRPDQVLAVSGFQYLRGYGIALFGGTETGGRVSLRLYIYPGFDYDFACYVGLPARPGAQGASSESGFKVEETAGGSSGPVRLRDIKMSPVGGVGDPPPALPGILKVSWHVEPQALPGAVGIAIWQQDATAWAFHFCSVSRRKS